MKKLSFLFAVTIFTMIGCNKKDDNKVVPVTPVLDSVKVIKGSPSDRAYINFIEFLPGVEGSQMVEGKNYPIKKGSYVSIYGSTQGEIYLNNVRVMADTLQLTDYVYDSVYYPPVKLGLIYTFK